MVVWVVVASKYGSTREVAEAIAEEFGRPHEVQVREAAELENFEGADAVVLGSAIYGGRWLEPARRLIEERSGELAAHPTWLFSVGPLGEPPKPEERAPRRSPKLWRRRRHGRTRSSRASSTAPRSVTSSG